MNAGQLRERITILRQRIVSDGLGGQSREFDEVATVWASVLPVRAGAVDPIAETAMGIQGYKIVTRFRDDIDIDWRIDWRGKRLAVVSAADMNGRRQFVTIFTDLGVVTD